MFCFRREITNRSSSVWVREILIVNNWGKKYTKSKNKQIFAFRRRTKAIFQVNIGILLYYWFNDITRANGSSSFVVGVLLWKIDVIAYAEVNMKWFHLFNSKLGSLILTQNVFSEIFQWKWWKIYCSFYIFSCSNKKWPWISNRNFL